MTSIPIPVQYIVSRPYGGYVSAEGHSPAVYLSDEEGDAGQYVHGCGNVHEPDTDENPYVGPECGTDYCHGRPADDA